MVRVIQIQRTMEFHGRRNRKSKEATRNREMAIVIVPGKNTIILPLKPLTAASQDDSWTSNSPKISLSR